MSEITSEEKLVLLFKPLFARDTTINRTIDATNAKRSKRLLKVSVDYKLHDQEMVLHRIHGFHITKSNKSIRYRATVRLIHTSYTNKIQNLQHQTWHRRCPKSSKATVNQ